MRYREFHKDPLVEYPNYNAMGSGQTKKPNSPTTQKSSDSPTTQPKPSQNIASAGKLQKDDEFPDDQGNVVRVISPAGQQDSSIPDDAQDSVIVKNTKTGDTYAYDPEQQLSLPNADAVNEESRKSMAKDKKRQRLKRLIRKKTFDRQGKVLFEINFNNQQVIKNALDSSIQCGFEAEAVFPDLESEEQDINDLSWSEVEDIVRDQHGVREVSRIESYYREWIMESDKFLDIELEITQDLVNEHAQEPAYIDDYVKENVSESDVESYKEEYLDSIKSDVAELISRAENEESDPDGEPKVAQRYRERAERTQKELEIAQDWDYQEWAREYVENKDETDFRTWLEEEIRDAGEAWDPAWERAMDEISIDDWMQSEYGDWETLLVDFYLYLPPRGLGNIVDEAADLIMGWTSSHSKFSEVRAGDYHSGSTDTQTQDQSYWRVEEDGSLGDNGVEIISPVYSTPREMIREMFSLFKYFEENNVETDNSTGLHVTMSMADENAGDMNKLKLAMLLGDQYLLDQFDRRDSNYTQSQMDRIENYINDLEDSIESAENIKAIEDIISLGLRTDKFSSINFQNKTNTVGNDLVEFRIAGNEDYHSDTNKVAKTVVRYAATLQAAYDPEAYKNDYIKAIQKLVAKVKDGVTDKELKNTLGGKIPTTPLAQVIKELSFRSDYLDNLEIVQNIEAAAAMDKDSGKKQAKKLFLDLMSIIILGFLNHEYQVKNDIMTARVLRNEIKRFGVTLEDIRSKFDETIHDEFHKEAMDIFNALIMKKVGSKVKPKQTVKYSPEKGEMLLMSKGKMKKILNDQDIDLSEKDFIVVNTNDYIAVRYAKFGPENENQEAVTAFKNKYGIDPGHPNTDEWIEPVNNETVYKLLINHRIKIMRESKFDKFDKLSLTEKINILSKIDKQKIDSVWNKRVKSLREQYKKKQTESAVPDRDDPADLKRLMSKPLLASDIGAQMQAYFAIPNPSMLKAFRERRSALGDDADLRDILRGFAEADLHPRELKKANIKEGKITRTDLVKADQEYFLNLLELIRQGKPIVDLKTQTEVIIDRSEADRLAKLMFPNGDPNNAQVDTSGSRPKYTPADPQAFSSRNPMMLDTNQGPVSLYTLDKDILKGDAPKYNKGDVAEALMGAAVVDFFRTGGEPTVEGIKNIFKEATTSESGTVWSLISEYKIKHKTGKQDNLKFTLRLFKGSLSSVLDWAEGKIQVRAFDNIARSSQAFTQDIEIGSVSEALVMIESDPDVNTVEITTDGVSDQTGTKADLIMSIDGATYNLLSLKVGQIKQIGQVSGYRQDVLENFFRTTFGVDLPPVADKLNWETPRDSMKSFKKIQQQLIKDIKKEVSDEEGSDMISRLFRGITYHATRDDDKVDLVITGETSTASYNILKFDQGLYDRMNDMSFDVVTTNASESSVTIKVVATGGELLDKFNEKYPRADATLVQVRMGIIGEASKDYMRNRVEIGKLMKFLADKSWSIGDKKDNTASAMSKKRAAPKQRPGSLATQQKSKPKSTDLGRAKK